MFYQSIVASVIFFAVVCWGCCLDSSKTKGGKENSDKINKLIKKAGSVIGMVPDSLETVTRLRIGRKLYSILDNNEHPLFAVFDRLKIPRSGRLRAPIGSDRFGKTFVPTAVRFFNEHYSR